MNQSIRKMLNSSERQLLRETEPTKLRKRDEDELVELHRRVRRARTKYAKLYRRRAAAQVKAHGTRAMASKSNKRTSVKAEVFEDALSRVSRRLAKVAAAQADELRVERLAAARGARSGKQGKKSSRKNGKKSGRKSPNASKHAELAREQKQRRTPQRKRAAASSRAATRRKEAKRARR